MAQHIYNFNAGPAILPAAVLDHAQEELRDYEGTGISVMEMSHRSKEFEAINSTAETLIKELMGVDAGWRALFLQGGASLQFSMVPLNLLAREATADIVVTGSWGEKARDEAAKIGNVHVAASTETGGYRRVPPSNEIHLSDAPAYIHITSNETIQGVQWQTLPSFAGTPVVADMSSDILSRPINTEDFALIYAGAQKNLGPSGVTVVLIREELIARAPKSVPTMLRYETHAKTDSLYNTPPTFGVYMLGLVLRWIKDLGGAQGMATRNERKAAQIYDAIDTSSGFYMGHADIDSRSRMNITFRLPSPDLEKRFATESEAAGMIGLKGHRSVGGIRASIYNAMDEAGCMALADFMRAFAQRNG